ncbi:hypothetical protein [Georgenia sp. AZ-5]|uniref:hypothetical protein n=1 Tax=Georgenia sp. AZ-5 TaxID=3367526 RepID=UPI0037541E67
MFRSERARRLSKRPVWLTEEWSDGAVTIELLYSGSRVPVNEMNVALAEGLVDMGIHQPTGEPELFPITSYLGDLMFLHETTPFVGALQGVAAWTEVGLTEPAVRDEMRTNGIQPLMPLSFTGGAFLLCAGEPVTSLDDAGGKRIRVTSAAHKAEVEALGAARVSLPVPELYEGLQRGVIDCVDANLLLASVMGLTEVTDAWTIDSGVQFSGTPTSFGMTSATWDGLDLPVRQLLWDRLDVFIEAHIQHSVFETYVDGLTMSQDGGLSFNEWEPDARTALEDHFESVLASHSLEAPAGLDGEAIVNTVNDAHAEWLERVGELGFSENPSWAEFADWFQTNEPDLRVYVDALAEKVLAPQRPAQ